MMTHCTLRVYFGDWSKHLDVFGAVALPNFLKPEIEVVTSGGQTCFSLVPPL